MTYLPSELQYLAAGQRGHGTVRRSRVPAGRDASADSGRASPGEIVVDRPFKIEGLGLSRKEAVSN